MPSEHTPLPVSRRTFLGAAAAGVLPLAARAGERASVVDRLRGLRPGHPRLHFGAADVRRLREPTGRRVRYARLLLDWVDRNRDWWPSLPPADPKFGNTVLEEAGAIVTNAALAFVVGGRPEHLALARRRALEMCDYPRDSFNYYSLGMYAACLARAYDWLHAEFRPAERQRLRTHLARMVEALYAGSFAGTPRAHWWAVYPLHHDYWIPVGGFGEAALALLGEEAAAAAWAARARALFDVSLGWLGDDGAWHEGVGDWCYAVSPLLTFYGAWRSATGEDLHDRPWLRQTARYRLYHWLPGDRYVALNDSFRDGRYGPTGAASCHLLRRLAALFRDGHAQWLADRDEPYDLRPAGKGVQRAPHEQLSFRDEVRDDPHADAYCPAWNVLWYDESVPARPPDDLPRAHHFANEGVVIARTGWDGPAVTVVSLACAPPGGQRCAARVRQGEAFALGNVAHAHASYAAFTLFARGEYFIVPPGYARRASRFQNVVAVNGADFRVDPGLPLRLVAFRSEDRFTYAVADATAGFPAAANVAHYRRHLLLWHADGRVIVFDDLRLGDTRTAFWNDFQWTLHGDPRTHRVSAAGRRLTWQPLGRAAPRLTVDVVEPEAFAWEHARLEALDGRAMLEAHRLVRPEWYPDRMRVLAVFSTADDSPPTVVRHGRFLAVGMGREQPLVGFALAPTTRADMERLAEPRLAGRELLLFGHDPRQADASLSFRGNAP